MSRGYIGPALLTIRAVAATSVLLLAGCSALSGLITGGQGPSSVSLPPSGGSATVAFSNDQGSNRDTSPYKATNLSGFDNYFPTIGPIPASWRIGALIIEASGTEPGSVVEERNVEVNVEGPKPAAGASYPLDKDTSSVFYEETVDSAASGSGKVWQSNGGTFTIESVSSSSLTFSIAGATMAVAASGSLPGISTNTARGTFTLVASGTISDFTFH